MKTILANGRDMLLFEGRRPLEVEHCPFNKVMGAIADFETSHEVFKRSMPGGFAWEVLEVLSG